MGVSFGQALVGGMAGAKLPGGYRVVIYTPIEWIKQQASDAARKYKPFTLSDLTPGMVENVVRVRVYPSLPTYVSSGGTMLASSVDHVVIRDAQRQRVVQPIRTELFSETAQNAMGATAAYHGVDAIFDMKEVVGIREQNEGFFITIVGTLGERNVKVNRRSLTKLAFISINPSELHLADTPVTQAKTPYQAAIADAMAKASALMASVRENVPVQSDRNTKPDELVLAADVLLQSLRKVDASFKVVASQDLLTSALIDAQMRLDDIQHRENKQRLQRTIESSAFALHGFLEARNNSGQSLSAAREALETAAHSFELFKSTGSEPENVNPLLAPTSSSTPAVQRSNQTEYPSVITIH